MTPALRYPPKPARGDAVAVLSPSAGLPGLFPLPFELGLVRQRNLFGLRPRGSGERGRAAAAGATGPTAQAIPNAASPADALP